VTDPAPPRNPTRASWFCDLYREWAGRLKPTLRQVHPAGERLFVDFAGRTVPVVEGTSGEERQAEIFVAVLGASSFTYACATRSQTLPDWIGAHVRAFGYFGGVARQVVSDNLKAGIYGAMAAHYGTAILPARPYKPRDKAKVEVGVQVVHQRHLLANLRQAVERWLAGAHGRLRRLPAMPDEAGAVPARRTGPFPCSAADEQVRADSRERRLALYGEVQRRQAAGEPLIAIARAMKLARGTVRSYAHASSFPERAARRPGHSTIDRHLPHLQARVAEGCEDGAVLWQELQAQGFTGTARLVRRWLSERRRKPARTAPHRWRGRAPANPGLPNDSTPTPLPAARQLAWLLVQSPTTLPAADAAAVARVEQDQDAAAVAKLARRFTALVRGCNVGNQTDAVAAGAELDAWLAEAGKCGVPTMETFAAGLKQDADAIRAALTTPWSNGQTEGQVNRLKTIKRQMYGHASFDLLRRRVLLAA